MVTEIDPVSSRSPQGDHSTRVLTRAASNGIDKLQREFFEYLEIEKGSSQRTIENYQHYLGRFLEHTKIKNASDITDDVLREFRLWLNRQPVGNGKDPRLTLSKKTQNFHLIALRVFLKYLAKRDIKSMASDRIELA